MAHEGLFGRSQVQDTRLCHELDEPSQCSHPTYFRTTLILSSHIQLDIPGGVFPSGFPTKTLHAVLVSYICTTCSAQLTLLIWSPKQYLVGSTNNEAPHCVIYYSLLLLPASEVTECSPATCDRTPSAYNAPITWETKCHTRIIRQVQLQFCVFLSLLLMMTKGKTNDSEPNARLTKKWTKNVWHKLWNTLHRKKKGGGNKSGYRTCETTENCASIPDRDKRVFSWNRSQPLQGPNSLVFSGNTGDIFSGY